MDFYLVKDSTAEIFCELLRFPNIRNLIYLTRHLEVRVILIYRMRIMQYIILSLNDKFDISKFDLNRSLY